MYLREDKNVPINNETDVHKGRKWQVNKERAQLIFNQLKAVKNLQEIDFSFLVLFVNCRVAPNPPR